MESEITPIKETQALKKLGFDELCFGYYENQSQKLILNYNNHPLTKEQSLRPGMYKTDHKNSTLPQWASAAPTFRQAFKWFKKNHDIITCGVDWDDKHYFYFIKSKDVSVSSMCMGAYKTEEKAELELLKKLIVIAKKRK